MKLRDPIPVESLLSVLRGILRENIGNYFSLEIDEHDVEKYGGRTIHAINITLDIEEDLPQTPIAKPELKDEEVPF